MKREYTKFQCSFEMPKKNFIEILTDETRSQYDDDTMCNVIGNMLYEDQCGMLVGEGWFDTELEAYNQGNNKYEIRDYGDIVRISGTLMNCIEVDDDGEYMNEVYTNWDNTLIKECILPKVKDILIKSGRIIEDDMKSKHE